MYPSEHPTPATLFLIGYTPIVQHMAESDAVTDDLTIKDNIIYSDLADRVLCHPINRMFRKPLRRIPTRFEESSRFTAYQVGSADVRER